MGNPVSTVHTGKTDYFQARSDLSRFNFVRPSVHTYFCCTNISYRTFKSLLCHSIEYSFHRRCLCMFTMNLLYYKFIMFTATLHILFQARLCHIGFVRNIRIGFNLVGGSLVIRLRNQKLFTLQLFSIFKSQRLDFECCCRFKNI